jgi:hypothetical protein
VIVRIEAHEVVLCFLLDKNRVKVYNENRTISVQSVNAEVGKTKGAGMR